MAWRRRSKQSSITSLMNCSRVFDHHHPLQLTHLSNNNNNNDYLHRASRVPLAFGQTVGAAVDTSVAPAVDPEDDEYAGDYEDEVDQNQNYMQPPAPPPAGTRS